MSPRSGLSFQESVFDFASAFGLAGGLMDLSGRLTILKPPFRLGPIYKAKDVNYTLSRATTPEPSSAALCAVVVK